MKNLLFINLFLVIQLIVLAKKNIFISAISQIYKYTNLSNVENSASESQLEIVNEWKYLDFVYPTFVDRQKAIQNG